MGGGRTALGVLLIALFSGILLGLTACGDVRSDLVTPAQPVWSNRVDLVGSAAVVDDVVLSYVNSGDDRLEIVAWDVATGVELWRDGVAIQGHRYDWLNVATASAGDDELVGYLQDDETDPTGWWQRLVVAEPRTGQHLAIENPVVQARGSPAQCADGADICVEGWLDDDTEGPRHTYRLDPDSGRLARDPSAAGLPAGAWYIATHVFSAGGRTADDPEQVGYAVDGAISWQRAYADVFGAGYSVDGGWQWIDRPGLDVVIGVGSPSRPEVDALPVAEYPLTDSVTVALRRADGTTVWRMPAADPWCGPAGVSSDLIHQTLPLCRYDAGSFTVDRSDPDDVTATVHGVDATLLGVDPETGAERWTLPLGSDDSIYPVDTSEFRSTLARQPVSIDGTLTMVDVLSGETTTAPARARVACETDREPFRARVPGSDDPGELHEFSAGAGTSACDGHARPLDDDAFTVGAVEMAGIDAGDGWFIVDGVDSVSGYRIEE
ncbi:hypothetical protein HD599_000472 [Conyzicola lurida]|uniref:Uncharacterized protein n=1 Tax=Conyzicola lurida TaxID=1172621 RepID=A0A841AL34_9MICO|nr:hypothetical protein [Conyzicola lurida]MBB5842149.1 hypothetical protein [Conyzicola lurida]